ncbi:hypothetical protein C4573_02795 [Candidatus Woesearchaeota archaeon]|nr:MAG: hypothetical protein C4573_02795 [Candidatus Woesearchaeota archaeon]
MKEDDIHREILKEALAEKEEKPSKVWPYIWVGIGLLIIILLILAYTGGISGIYFIKGRTASGEIQNFQVDFEEGKVIFEPSVYEALKNQFLANYTAEFKVCLLGEKQGKNYIITSFYTPIIFSQDFTSVHSVQCNSSTIIPLHSHPVDSCLFSDQDKASFKAFKEVNPDAIYGLMCSANRFSFIK